MIDIVLVDNAIFCFKKKNSFFLSFVLLFFLFLPRLIIYNLIIMNNASYDFIIKVADLVAHYSQFPEDVCHWIGCQFALESSYGSSHLAINNNNYCGMRNPLVRISSAIHAGDSLYHWAQYADLDCCIIDYLLCVQYHRPLSIDYASIGRYSRFVSNFYCPERDYIERINLIYQQLKSFQNEQSN